MAFADLSLGYMEFAAIPELKVIDEAVVTGTQKGLDKINERWKNLISPSRPQRTNSNPDVKVNDSVAREALRRKDEASKQLDRMPFGLFKLQDGTKPSRYYLLTEKTMITVGKKTFRVRFVYSLSRFVQNSPRAAVLVVQCLASKRLNPWGCKTSQWKYATAYLTVGEYAPAVLPSLV